MFALFISMVNADLTTNLHSYWSFDNSTLSGSVYSDLIDGNDATFTSVTFGGPCLINECFNNNGAGYSDTVNLTVGNGQNEQSVNLWYKSNVIDATNRVMFAKNNGVIGTMQIQKQATTDSFLVVMDTTVGGSQVFYFGNVTETFDNNWHMLTYSWTGGRIITYIDAVLTSNDSLSGVQTTFSESIDISGKLSSNRFVGNMDETGFWTRGITPIEVGYLYNSGAGCNPVTDATSCTPATLEVEMNTSLINNTEFFNDAQLNFTYKVLFLNVVPNTTLGNVTFYYNGVLNLTFLDIDLNITNKINFTLPVDAEYPINVSINASTNGLQARSGIFYYNVDVLEPRVNQSGLINNSNYEFNSVLSTNVSMYDPNLFSYNISIINIDTQAILENYFASNLTVQFTDNDTVRTLSSLGNFTFKIDVWDSHTKEEIKDYKVDKLNDGFEFNDVITITSPDLKSTEHTTIKKKDRYEFEFDFKKGINWRTIYLESDGNLFYVEDSNYKGHFVDFKNKKWIDFQSRNVEDYVITKINNKKYEIKIKFDKNLDKVKFNSIGDLNQFSEYYFYSVVQTPVVQNTTEINLTGLEQALTGGFNTLSSSFLSLGILFLMIFFIILGTWMKEYYIWLLSSAMSLLLAVRYYIFENMEDSILSLTFIILSIGITGLAFWFMMNKKQKNKDDSSDFYAGY